MLASSPKRRLQAFMLNWNTGVIRIAQETPCGTCSSDPTGCASPWTAPSPACANAIPASMDPSAMSARNAASGSGSVPSGIHAPRTMRFSAWKSFFDAASASARV